MSRRGVRIEHCAGGRLGDAYPVNAHDVEVRVHDRLSAAELSVVLGAAVEDALASDPRCRRVVFAAEVADVATITAAEAAGFRHVVDVDLPDAELSLLVAEPAWVTAVDIDLDRVPGT
ncbi:MAG TPA: hypothetical protein VJ870_02105 [Amycolatopsis sp.]|nr:hypothetical protein [Amycolatopsis sp.]